jgi:hypothetical protein
MRFVDRAAWRIVFFGLCSFPAFLSSGLLRLVGQRERADVVAAWIRRQWLAAESARRIWVALPVSLFVSAITSYLLTGIAINVAYPLRSDQLPTDWGGPSLAGRWAVHAIGGLVFGLVTPMISVRLRNISRRMLVGPAQRRNADA